MIQEFFDTQDLDISGILENITSGFGTALMFLAILLIGLFVVGLIKKLLKKALEVLKIDQNLEKIGVKEEMKSAGLDVNFSEIISMIVGVFLKLIVWMAAIDVLKIPALSEFMGKVIDFVPNIFVGLIILITGAAMAKVVADIIAKTFGKSAPVQAKTGALIAKVAIIGFSFMAALQQLEIEAFDTLLKSVLNGLSLGFAGAFAIAFGMGGKDKVADCINKTCSK